MAKAVENVFVDVTLLDERPYVAQHQKLFPGNVIARFEIGKSVYLKVPYLPTEQRCIGLTREAFETLLPVAEMA